MLALTDVGASLPVVGKALEPLGGMTAMSIWGVRHMPDFVAAAAKGLRTPSQPEVRRRDRESSRVVSEAALRGIVSAQDLAGEWPAVDRMPPMGRALFDRKLLFRSGVHYGDSPAQVLDVWRPRKLPTEPAPVLIFLPGGAWVHGSRMLQGSALLARLAELGWVCLAIDYRVAPHHPWPRHIQDVKTAIAWARANVDRFGGDRNFITIAGCSAGGHLAALAGLTAGDPVYESELPEGSDTSVDAVVGIYGRYDWEDRSTIERDRFVEFLERIVVKRRIARHPEIFRDASPIARVHRNAPPFLVVHGSRDSVIPVAQARSFVERLRAASHSTVGYLELPGAGHGFDLIDGERAGVAAHATSLFLNQVYRAKAIAAKEVI
jgi:acetyl esterase/lipase